MTPNIQQHVIPRHRRSFSFTSSRSSGGLWLTRRHTRRQTGPGRLRVQPHGVGSRASRAPRTGFSRAQRGSITNSTVTAVMGMVALVMLAGLGFFYLQQVLNTASQGGNIQDLESEISQLRQDQRQLELEGAQLRSLQTVEQNVEKLNLVATQEVSFLSLPEGHVAAAIE